MKPTSALLLLLLLLSASISKGADPVAVEVTIQSVNNEARQIAVLYNTKNGHKTISLDVSRKAEITLNSKAASLQSLVAGLKAKIEYNKDLAIVTKIKATGTIKKIAPVVRLKLYITEYGDVTFSAIKTEQAAPDDFEGTALAVPHLPGTKAWKGANGHVRLVHSFGDGTKATNLAWQHANVSIDQGTKALVFKPQNKTKEAMSRLSYFQRVHYPVTIVVDVAQHDSGPFVVKLLDYAGKWGTLYCEIKAKKGKKYAVKALWVERDKQKKPVITELFNVRSTTLDKPFERKFRLPVPNARIDQSFGIELGKAFDVQPTAISRLEVRGQLIPMLGIGLKQQGQVVFVKHIFPNGLAERAGIKVGDIISKINGKQPQTLNQTLDLLGEIRFGQKVHLVIERAGTKKELRFTAM